MSKTDNILKYGWLVRSPSSKSFAFSNKKWKPEYFALIESTMDMDSDGAEFKYFLSSYTNELDFMNIRLASRQYCLDDCTEVCAEHVGDDLHVILLRYCEKDVYLIAKTEDETLQWVKKLRFCRFGQNKVDVGNGEQRSEGISGARRKVVKRQIQIWRESWSGFPGVIDAHNQRREKQGESGIKVRPSKEIIFAAGDTWGFSNHTTHHELSTKDTSSNTMGTSQLYVGKGKRKHSKEMVPPPLPTPKERINRIAESRRNLPPLDPAVLEKELTILDSPEFKSLVEN